MHIFSDNPRDKTNGLSELPALEGELVKQDLLTSKELCDLSGASYRQLDYWCSKGIISSVGENSPGTGSRRLFAKDIVDKVKLVVKISNAFNRTNSPLQYIVEHYEDGEFDMGDGVYLTWDTVEIERDTR